MKEIFMELKQLSITNIEQIEELFASVFTREPWNDDNGLSAHVVVY